MQMQRTYEVMFIVRPDQSDEDIDKLISNLESNVTTAGGTVKSFEKMGKRRLAYIVRKFMDGFYILLTLEGSGELVKEIERRLRVTEQVIKFISVRTEAAAAAAAQAATEAGAEPSPAAV
jgi:small subunit ribosomal protein S6